jgi:hypothetical protein
MLAGWSLGRVGPIYFLSGNNASDYKQGMKRSSMVDGYGIPLDRVSAVGASTSKGAPRPDANSTG